MLSITKQQKAGIKLATIHYEEYIKLQQKKLYNYYVGLTLRGGSDGLAWDFHNGGLMFEPTGKGLTFWVELIARGLPRQFISPLWFATHCTGMGFNLLPVTTRGWSYGSNSSHGACLVRFISPVWFASHYTGAGFTL